MIYKFQWGWQTMTRCGMHIKCPTVCFHYFKNDFCADNSFFFLQRWDKSIPFTVERKVPLNIEKNQWKWEYPRQTENLNPGEHMFHHKELNQLNAYFSIFSLESVSFSLLKGICKYKMVLPHKKNFLRGKFSRFWKNIRDWKEVFVKVEKKILA